MTKAYWVYGPKGSGKTHWIQSQPEVVTWYYRGKKTPWPEDADRIGAIVVDGPIVDPSMFNELRMYAGDEPFVLILGHGIMKAIRPGFLYVATDKSLEETFMGKQLEEMRRLFQEIKMPLSLSSDLEAESA